MNFKFYSSGDEQVFVGISDAAAAFLRRILLLSAGR